MSFKLSVFGEKFSQKSGIVTLMDDLGTALNENPELIFMGGGNPARIPPVEEYFQQRLEQISNSEVERFSLLGVYQSPQGEKEVRGELAQYIQQQIGWDISADNIAFTNGSQSAFFTLYNMLAGDMPDGRKRTIHFPLAPEYVGYADAGLSEDFFTSSKPAIEEIDAHKFKYRIDFDDLKLDDSIAALSVSRPTNPTGNVITDEELKKLDELAEQHGIPLIIDGAYGLPFPNITFAEATPHWNNNTILVLSLSKLGLPAVRTGIVIANSEFINKFTIANTIGNLAPASTGPVLAKGLFESDSITRLTSEIQTYYMQKAAFTTDVFQHALEGIPFKIHKAEGAIFLWLWFEGLPISSFELYQRLKAKGVLIIPGEEFFIGLSDWKHSKECIRVSYAQSPEVIQQGVSIIAEEVRSLYESNK